MKQVALVTSLTIGALLVPTSAEAIPLRADCRFGHHLRWNEAEVQRTIRCAVARWSVPGGVDYALYIANRESNFQQFAYNPSGCSGIYQWARGTWESVQHRFPAVYRSIGWHSVWSARGNVLYAIRYAHEFGWGPWS